MTNDRTPHAVLDHPMIFPHSRLQLVPTQENSFIGFTSLNFQGARNWKWESFFRPFLRIEDDSNEVPSMHAFPNRCEQSNALFSLKVSLHSADTLVIDVHAKKETWMHLGPAGTHDNFGGLVEQQFLVFWGDATRQTVVANDIICRTEGVSAVFHAPNSRIETGVSGHRIRLNLGDNRFTVATGNEAQVSELTTIAHKAYQAPTSQSSDIPDLNTTHNRALWTIASSTFEPEGQCTHRFLGACKTAYTKGTWLWDTCFAVRGYAAYDPQACKDWLRNFIVNQQADGMFPGMVGPSLIADTTQVPLFSWAANAILAADNDPAFRKEACDAATRNNDWWMTLADPQCGGLPVTQPISYDNSPLYDGLRIKEMQSRQSLALPDIIAALVIDCDEISTMATQLGDDALAQRMQARRTFLAETAHSVLYNEEAKFYYASKAGEQLALKTGPALTSIVFAPDAVAAQLVKDYMHPGSPAWPKHGIATVMSDESSYDPSNFWRGAIWSPVNRLVIDALARRGFSEAAENLRKETLSQIENSGHFREVYHPVSGIGSRAMLMSGFGAGVYLDLEHPSRP